MTGFLILIAIVAGAVVGVYAVSAALVWYRYRGTRTITCPETGHPAQVRVDVGHAVLSDILENDVDVRVAHCSRWSDRGECDQPCRPQLASGTPAPIVIE